MTREEILEYFKDINHVYNDCTRCDTLKRMLGELEQEPCEDRIIEWKKDFKEYVNSLSIPRDDYKGIMEYIDELPVTPQPKTGHWEWVQYDYNPKLGNWHCSECRCIFLEFVEKNEKSNIPLYKYCPQCGAKMVESEDKE